MLASPNGHLARLFLLSLRSLLKIPSTNARHNPKVKSQDTGDRIGSVTPKLGRIDFPCFR